MRCRQLLSLLILLFAIPAMAQQTQTKVTGTIVDPNSVPYYPATVLACLTPPTQNPTVAGAAISTNPGVPYCVGPAQTGPAGTFQIPLYANSVIQCNNVACSTQWQFTVTATGTAPPAGKGPQNFQVVLPITSLTLQDISNDLSSAAPVLLNSGGGGGSIGPGTPTNVSCFNTTTNVKNCAHQITDTPGVGVNIPANTTIGGGGTSSSLGMPAGPTAGCQTPQTGWNIFCSDSGLNTMDLSLNGAAYTPICVTTTGCGGGSGSAQTFNVLNYGAVGDGYHIAADTAGIKAAIAAASPVCGVVYFPGNHTYQFDTAAAAYPISGFCGTIQGDGYSSWLISNNDTNSMLDFRFPMNLTVKDMHFEETPSGFLTNGFPVAIDSGINILIKNNYTNDGNTGWRIGNSYHVRFEGNSCSTQHGNCLFGPNDNDIHSVNTSCFNNGDTCEEYSRWHFETSPTCSQITSTGMNSFNDGTGLIVDSCTDVAISNFTILNNGGGAQGAIFIGQDHNTTTDHYPTRIQLSNGTIYGASYSNGNINQSANVAAININTTDAISEPFDIALSNIRITHSSAAAIKVLDPNNVITMETSNLWLSDVGNGQTLGVGSPQGEGIYWSGGKSLKMSNTYVENAYGRSIQLVSGNSTVYTELNGFTSVNPMQGGTGTVVASIWNRNTGGTFVMNGINIVDTWPSANRSTIINAATSGIQNASNINFNCTVACSQPSYSFVNPFSNAGGTIHSSGFGGTFTNASAACETSFAPTTVSGGATTTTGLTCLPANAIIDSVVYRITTTITTATSFTIGDSGSATRYCGTQSTMTAGTTGICTAAGYYLNPSPAKGVLFTPNATPGAGAIRFIVYYHTWSAPTS